MGVRALSPATAWAPPFDRDVQRWGQRIEQLWKETLRYSKNEAHLYEMRQSSVKRPNGFSSIPMLYEDFWMPRKKRGFEEQPRSARGDLAELPSR